ncbi:uncharacterized protein B0I36DRAFT_356734 [Microdochium trichocladiopsis]|uniref:FHA domain-containing protein n=1 Tax=Microdochium trichocladiopsis TaxID=1682393 RepID=A0A9P9BHU6_9PEZI|nr:uncharacterized protein B0I36DRAFT_356734 [Microdochium trichocladiopsis]KAH7009237.1 hypothetical protein B0I36DRAFT_356734 [Microdochium trichocladiopsis]
MLEKVDSNLFVFGRKFQNDIADFVIAPSGRSTISRAHFGICGDEFGYYIQKLGPNSFRVNGIELLDNSTKLGLNVHVANVVEVDSIRLEVLCCRSQVFHSDPPPQRSEVSRSLGEQACTTILGEPSRFNTQRKDDLWYYPHELAQPNMAVAIAPWTRQQFLVSTHKSADYNRMKSSIRSLQALKLFISLTPLRTNTVSVSRDLRNEKDKGCQGMARRVFWGLFRTVLKLHGLNCIHGNLNADNVYISRDARSPNIFIGGFCGSHAPSRHPTTITDCWDIFKLTHRILGKGSLAHRQADKLLQIYRTPEPKSWGLTVADVCGLLKVDKGQVRDIWSSLSVSREFDLEVTDSAVLAHRAETYFLHQTGAQTGNWKLRKHVPRALNLAPPQEKCNRGFTEPSIKLEDLAHAARHLSRKYEVPNSV